MSIEISSLTWYPHWELVNLENDLDYHVFFMYGDPSRGIIDRDLGIELKKRYKYSTNLFAIIAVGCGIEYKYQGYSRHNYSDRV